MRAALYLRSSKDRSDVSIDAQRRELKKLANDRKLEIIHEYTDVVESAKSANRPGFQAMLHDLKSPTRNWDALLMSDTSRLSRRRYVAQAFKHDARKRNVEIIYSKVPDVDPITAVILDSVFEAMDEVHSLMSKDKGLAGMAENVRQGYRAGGRAPRGYKLKKIDTGAIRDGESVIKTKLETTSEAPLIGRLLKSRAQRVPRAKTTRDLSIKLSASTLIDMEWNALTYAGHTVWNVRNEKSPDGGYIGGKKRKPRSEWMVQKNTHDAIITDDEAEVILTNLENSKVGQSVSAAKTGNSPYLLTGILKTPDGEMWIGDNRTHYRIKKSKSKGRYVPVDSVDQAVTQKLIGDMKSRQFIKALTRKAHKYCEALQDDPAKVIRQEIVMLSGRISKTMDLATDLDDPGPALRKINELESKRKMLAAEVTQLESEYSAQASLKGITEAQVGKILEGFADNFATLPQGRWKDAIKSLVDQIILDPNSLEFQIHYRIPVENRLCMASPRGFEPLLPA